MIGLARTHLHKTLASAILKTIRYSSVAFNRRSAREKKRAREGVVYLSERVLSRDPLRSAGSHTLDGTRKTT